MWITANSGCYMEHTMLWTCLKPHLRPEKAILVSLWRLNFSPWCLPGLWPQICPGLSLRTPQNVWNLLPLLLQMKLIENMILFYLIFYQLSFLSNFSFQMPLFYLFVHFFLLYTLLPFTARCFPKVISKMAGSVPIPSSLLTPIPYRRWCLWLCCGSG